MHDCHIVGGVDAKTAPGILPACGSRRFLYLYHAMGQESVLNGIMRIAAAILPRGAEVVLFGSRARGDAQPDSDWDLLILVEGDVATGRDFDRFAYPFVDYGWSVGVTVNPLVYSYREWRLRSNTPFYKNVQKDGVCLCH